MLCCTINAALVRSNQLKKDAGKATFLFFSEEHQPLSQKDQDQFDRFKGHLLELGRTGESVSLLVERPCFVEFSPYRSITKDYEQAVASTNVTAENIEIRCVANAAALLLRRDQNPYTIMPEISSTSKDSQCVVGKVTFNDLFEEYRKYAQVVVPWASTFPKTGCNDVGTCFSEMEEKYKKFSQKIANLGINSEDRILETSQQLYSSEKNRRNRQSLALLNSNLYSRMLELHTLKHMLSLAQKKIMLIAGAEHVDNITSMLVGMGYQSDMSNDYEIS